jgi:poly(3-hydroxybutyrate) depolymerase
MYVPAEYSRLVVVVHGTERDAQGYRDAFSSFADDNDCIVLAPLFPVGIPDLDGYKYLRHGELRYDDILLAMVDEVAARYHVDAARFLLFGFSGGGHFAHRFLYLHPERLLAASIGAPGAVTLLDTGRAWPAGIADTEECLGCTVDLAAVAATPVQLVVGAEDVSTDGIAAAGHPAWIAGVNDAGVPRTARLRALRDSLEEHGVRVRHDVIPGAGHDARAIFGVVREFFTSDLS